MIHHFDTDDEHAGIAALLVYCLWRSRDTRRFKVTPEVWSQVERFTKAAAKRAPTLPRFIEAMQPRLCVGALAPRVMHLALTGEPPVEDAPRQFLTDVLARADDAAVMDRLYRETAYVILLLRDRLERERAIEGHIVDVAATEGQTTWT